MILEIIVRIVVSLIAIGIVIIADEGQRKKWDLLEQAFNYNLNLTGGE